MGTEKTLLLIIGTPGNLVAFIDKSGKNLEFYYRNNKIGWMTGLQLVEGLQHTNIIGNPPNRKIFLLMDNCRSYGSTNTWPHVEHINMVLFNQTQLADSIFSTGYHSAIKVKYRKL